MPNAGPNARSLLFIVIAAASIALPPIAPAQEIKLTFADQNSPTGWGPSHALQPWVKQVEEASKGKVKIEVVITPDGRVKSTRVIGGHPLLVQACQDAVKEWKFAAAPEETTQIVEFEFSAGGN